MSRDDPQLKLRLPPELRTQVEEASKKAGRSLNAEVVCRLAETFDKGPHVFISFSATEPESARLLRILSFMIQDCTRDELSVLVEQVKERLTTLNGMSCCNDILSSDLASS